jgi:RNA processing factor Prp31
MPFCGFNKDMLKGIGLFHKGLVEHGIIERSKIKNQMTTETINKEIEDMERFQKEIHRIENPEIRDLIKKLTEYAYAFYKLIKKKGVENYKEIIEKLNNLYFEMDNKFYSELEGKPDDMKELAIYMDKLSKEI